VLLLLLVVDRNSTANRGLIKSEETYSRRLLQH
jgi:hypothetical protein